MEKKEEKNNGGFKFLETLILTVLVIAVIVIVIQTFFEQLDENYYADYEDYDYYADYDDGYDYGYSYDYNYDYDYSYNDSINDYENSVENEVANFVSIEDFMKSDEGKDFLKEPNQNQINVNETISQNVVNVPENITTNNSETVDSDDNAYNYREEQNIMKSNFEKQKKNIEIKDEGKSINDEIMVSIKNNDKDFVYDITLNTIFYKDKEIIGIDVQDINLIDSNNTKYIKITECPDEYDGYEFLISKRYYMEYYNELLNDDVTFTTNENRGYVEISAKNNSSKKINRIHFTILYYDKSGKLVDFENVQDYSIRAKKTEELTGYGIWDDENAKYLQFDDYKVILDCAENYGY